LQIFLSPLANSRDFFFFISSSERFGVSFLLKIVASTYHKLRITHLHFCVNPVETAKKFF
jgi:hypothetical protein